MLSESYDVAACIVTYRSPLPELETAISSFFSQTGLRLFLTIVDNASGAAYVNSLKPLIGEHMQLIEAPKNGGFGYGNNLGIARSPASHYLLLLNPDVAIHEGTLATLMAYMDANPQVGVVTPKALHPDGTLQPLNKRSPTVLDLFLRRCCPPALQKMPRIERRMRYYSMLDVGYDNPCELEFMTGCFMFFRRSVLERTGGFDETFFMYLEDADLTRRTNAISKAMYFPDATITHHWRRGSHHNYKLTLVMLHSIRVYFRKWGWRWW